MLSFCKCCQQTREILLLCEYCLRTWELLWCEYWLQAREILSLCKCCQWAREILLLCECCLRVNIYMSCDQPQWWTSKKNQN